MFTYIVGKHTKAAINFKYSGSQHMMAFFRDRFPENTMKANLFEKKNSVKNRLRFSIKL